MRLKQIILGLILAAGAALAQPVQNVALVPECQIFLSAAAIATSVSWDNRSRGCDRWIVTYSGYGFAGAPPFSVAVQYAPNAAPGIPGAWANFVTAGADLLVAGINPNTVIAGALTSMTGYHPWMRLNLTAAGAAAGNITATLYGYKDRPATVIIPGIVATNLAQYGGVAVGAGNALHVRPGTGALFNLGTVVAGADTVANNAQVNPAAGAGGLADFQYYYNGGTWDRTRGSVAGAWVQGPAATTAAVVGNPVITGGYGSGAAPGVVAGATVCDLNATITLAAAAGYTEIIPLAAARSIRICHVSLSMTAPVDINLARAPAGACAGPVAITGVYSTVMALSIDFVNGPIVLTAANSLCINLGQAVAGGGLVSYALY
jgi:hypothetical protein